MISGHRFRLDSRPRSNFICERSFGLQAEVLFFRALGSDGGLETTATPDRKFPCEWSSTAGSRTHVLSLLHDTEAREGNYGQELTEFGAAPRIRDSPEEEPLCQKSYTLIHSTVPVGT